METGASLELPAFAAMPDKSPEKQDTLNSPGSFLTRPSNVPPLPLDEPSPASAENLARLRALRASPGFRLIADSGLLLKVCQMDMDHPPSWRDYVRQAFKEQLLQTTGKELSPDALRIRFTTDTNPEVDMQGRERFSRRLSLTEVAMLLLSDSGGRDLLACRFSDKPLDLDTPALTARVALELITRSRWRQSYTELMHSFWNKHRNTYRAVAKLGFLDNLAHHHLKQRISRDGYLLTLEALGLQSFPDSCLALLATGRGSLSTVSMVASGGLELPQAFQVQSDNTSHCFIHRFEREHAPIEYIGDQPAQMLHRLVEALPESALLEHGSGPNHLSVIKGDVFTALTAAQEKLSMDYLRQGIGISKQPDMFSAIERGMQVFAATDLFEPQPDILAQLPEPMQTAKELMAGWLRDTHGLHHDPDQVFVRYLRGHTLAPLGHVRHSGNDFSIPDDKSISLSEALVTQYRVPTATGHIDHGARNVVFWDATGKGEWAADRELGIDAQTIETMIREIDFLGLMNRTIASFWKQNRVAVESALQGHFVKQAVLCLKFARLRRSGFDLISAALEQLCSVKQDSPVEWSTPGFFLQHSAFEPPKTQYCPSLLILSHPSRPTRVLYQAGRLKAFNEFDNEHELNAYLRQAAREEQWRQAVLSHVPLRQQQRLDYIMKVWSGARPPNEPASILRPWTDALLNHDTRQALADNREERQISVSPFIHIRQTLEQNNAWDAQDIIVTSQEVTLLTWSRRLNHLQMLLAPLSVLLTPAAVASLMTELGIASLSVASATLPGARHAEKRQLTLDLLTLGLLQLPPVLPRLAGALRKISKPARIAARSPSAIAQTSKTFGRWLARSTQARQTTFERFPHTDTRLKSWSIPSNPTFSTLPVRAWKLRRQFLLWTAENRQARTLVVSTHGYYLPWSSTARIPNGTELQVYAPHGHELVDPGLHRVVNRRTRPFAILTQADNRPASAPQQPYVLTDKLMAGTSTPGSIRNYSLSKFQTPDNESYQDISRIVRQSNLSPLLGQVSRGPMDVLTVRNRFGTPHPTLEHLLDTLYDSGIHYDRIVLLHCRCAALKSLLGQAPVYKAP